MRRWVGVGIIGLKLFRHERWVSEMLPGKNYSGASRHHTRALDITLAAHQHIFSNSKPSKKNLCWEQIHNFHSVTSEGPKRGEKALLESSGAPEAIAFPRDLPAVSSSTLTFPPMIPPMFSTKIRALSSLWSARVGNVFSVTNFSMNDLDYIEKNVFYILDI